MFSLLIFMINYCLSGPECPHQYLPLSIACLYIYILPTPLQNKLKSCELYLNLFIILKLASADPILRYIEEACLYHVSTQWPQQTPGCF